VSRVGCQTCTASVGCVYCGTDAFDGDCISFAVNHSPQCLSKRFVFDVLWLFVCRAHVRPPSRPLDTVTLAWYVIFNPYHLLQTLTSMNIDTVYVTHAATNATTHATTHATTNTSVVNYHTASYAVDSHSCACTSSFLLLYLSCIHHSFLCQRRSLFVKISKSVSCVWQTVFTPMCAVNSAIDSVFWKLNRVWVTRSLTHRSATLTAPLLQRKQYYQIDRIWCKYSQIVVCLRFSTSTPRPSPPTGSPPPSPSTGSSGTTVSVDETCRQSTRCETCSKYHFSNGLIQLNIVYLLWLDPTMCSWCENTCVDIALAPCQYKQAPCTFHTLPPTVETESSATTTHDDDVTTSVQLVCFVFVLKYKTDYVLFLALESYYNYIDWKNNYQ